jgi:hypothetical protein
LGPFHLGTQEGPIIYINTDTVIHLLYINIIIFTITCILQVSCSLGLKIHTANTHMLILFVVKLVYLIRFIRISFLMSIWSQFDYVLDFKMYTCAIWIIKVLRIIEVSNDTVRIERFTLWMYTIIDLLYCLCCLYFSGI